MININKTKQSSVFKIGGYAFSSAIIFGLVGLNPAYAATTVKKNGVTKSSATTAAKKKGMTSEASATPPPAAPARCTGLKDFALTDCTLTLEGIRLYGTYDFGGGWMSNGTPMNDKSAAGQYYFIQKQNNGSRWIPGPNEMSQSNIGIKGTEHLNPKLDLIFDVQAGFNPYSLELANGPQSVRDNIGVPLTEQNGQADSSRAGQLYNSVGYIGLSHKTYGTLTILRQNTLTLDGVIAYDPMGASYAYSPIGWSGMTAGAGDTEDARSTVSAKYRLDIKPFRVAAFVQVGGYQWNNAASQGYQGQIGGDIANLYNGKLSLDAIGSYFRNAVSVSLAGNPVNAEGTPLPPFLPQVYTATLSNNSSVMALAKYTRKALTVFFGDEWINFAHPSSSFEPRQGFTDIASNFVCAGCAAVNGTNINTAAFGTAGLGDKNINVVWVGAKYSLPHNVDIIGAYYNYYQPSYFGTVATGRESCSTSAHSQCSGSMNAVSGVVDWKFIPKADVYAGAMYSQVNGGLANGFLHRGNVDPTVGLRFRF